jgi:LacI family transcriptional regulator
MKLSELARHLDLSTSTVSRALNGYSDVSAATRARVEEAALRLGYTPHPAGLKLRTGRTDMIAVILPRPQVQFATPFFLEILTGVDEVLSPTRFELIVTAVRERDDETTTFRRIVESRRVDALIFGRTRTRDARIAYLIERSMPFVALGRSGNDRRFAFIDIDHETSGRQAAERLARAGHRRIALVNTLHEFNYSRLCAKGFVAGLAAAGIAADAALMVNADMTEESGFDAMSRLLRVAPRPTAVACGNDMLAFGVLRAIRSAGLEPGRDVAVIGCDDHPLSRTTAPPLTTFAAPVRAAGAEAARMLLKLLDGAKPSDLQQVWQPELVVRASDGDTLPGTGVRPARRHARSA